MSLVLLLVLAAVAYGFLRFWLNYKAKAACLSKLEYVKMNPYFTAYIFFHQRSETLTEMLVGTAKVFTERSMVLTWPFLFPYLIINGPRQVEALLKSKNNTKSREYDSMKPWLGEGLIAASGEYWRLHRRILTPTFHYEILHSYVAVFAGHGKILCDKLAKFADSGEVFDIWPLFNMCTLDGICEAIIGRHFDAQGGSESAYAKAICQVTRIVRERMQRPWLWNDFLFSLTKFGREQKRCLSIIHGFGDEIVREKMEERRRAKATANGASSGDGGAATASLDSDGTPKKRKMAFLELLADLAEEGVLTEKEMRIQLDNFVFAGHDTSTMGLNWSIFLLGHHPQYQQRAQAELDAHIHSPADWNLENMKNLAYLEQCFKEAIRLYPPVPFMGRYLDEDLQIEDVLIPKGTSVSFVPYTIHRHPDFWPDAERYDPDRFSPEASLHRYPFSYIPFSAGSRNCIGQRFALLEAKVLLGMILQRFHVESVDEPHSVQPRVEMVLRPEAPIRLRLKHRQHRFAAPATATSIHSS